MIQGVLNQLITYGVFTVTVILNSKHIESTTHEERVTIPEFKTK